MTRQWLVLTLVVCLSPTAGAFLAVDHAASAAVMSLDGAWRLAVDPDDVGRQQQWWREPRPGAKLSNVPGTIQDECVGYHGVAWYWREFDVPGNPSPQGRTLLRFSAVDYLAEVWVNGIRVGTHEGGESPFVYDVTDTVKPGASNRLAVRVLNPKPDQRLDGIVQPEAPQGNRRIPLSPGSALNYGGIIDSVELLTVPGVYLEDLFVQPDAKTGAMGVHARLRNATQATVKAQLELVAAPAATGVTVAATAADYDLPVGETTIDAQLHLDQWHSWDLNEPYLYRVTARLAAGTPPRQEPSAPQHSKDLPVHELSVRCGFRDFRFENGYFRLNGRRIYLKSALTGNDYPFGIPHDPDLVRRDLVNHKAMGFDMIRFIARMPSRTQLDLCDAIGLLVYEECYGSWLLGDSPKMAERYDRSIAEMILRDRNHPSVVMWGLLNETPDGSVFRHAVTCLPWVRDLDDGRVVMLNSGRFDCLYPNGKDVVPPKMLGSLSNPGSTTWEDVLSDQHLYKRVPHTAAVIREFRTENGGGKPVFLSEAGVGSAVNLIRLLRHFEQLGRTASEGAVLVRGNLDRFMADWQRWKLADTWANPEDYFQQCLTKMAGQRVLGLDAVRSNPNIIGFSPTQAVDPWTGEGFVTLFRDLKPGTVDAVFNGWYPLRWCLFAEPVNVYRNTPIRLEAVLSNNDVLAAGEYPVRLQIVGPGAKCVFDRTLKVAISDPHAAPEPPMAIPVFAEDIVVDGPPGTYRFLATFEQGAAAAGGEAVFYVADPAELPKVETEVVLWGEDAELKQWLGDHGIRTRPFSSEAATGREVILASSTPQSPGGAPVFRELAQRMARGATVIFLSPAVFAQGDQSAAWVPLAKKGRLMALPAWLYHKDEWAKKHPVFEGLPAGGLMDYLFYREIIPDNIWMDQDPPAEVVAGAIDTSMNYSAGLMVSVHWLGAGGFILNTLNIRDNLGRNPPADRLLLNMLQYAARNAAQPLADLPTDFDSQLRSFGFQP